jgi:hypothetical protein
MRASTRPEHVDSESSDDLFRRTMEMHAEGFAAGRFEAAYHLLAAALHLAEDLNSVDQLNAIARLSIDRQAEIDRSHPGHRVSSVSSAKRGNPSLFTSLAATASAAIARIHAAAALEHSKEILESHKSPGSDSPTP